ncbi:hypothetical protein LOTGIDRAFT_157837 [Lottia gigantea]|uniref:Uncharacterized protein n=1 Tax=Lottia gigantea TaxID=225164 RepID=V4AZL2_LOTGI|nr:hypothetical protein LOTGIDRAFT_157837 [Lottia gigantea]ESP00561.1 hypothetical protein LOTGIDRAFT_157837 [Lottia gigantea]
MSAPSKGFNINLSRISPRGGQNSMLAYSEKLKHFREARERRQYANLGDALQVKAKHIPKISHSLPKYSQKKPAVTLKQISGRKTRSLDGDDVNRSVSPGFSLPGNITRTPRDKVIPEINVASASDDHDIVGYKIRKPNKFVDQATMTETISKTKVADYLRTNVLPPIKTDDFKKQVYKYSPRRGHITRIRRPNRAKRMELHGSFLDSIPECDSSTSPTLMSDSGSNTQTISSVRLQSRSSMLNHDTARLMGSIDLHIPTGSLRDKLGVELVHPGEITLNFKQSPRLSNKQYDNHARQLGQPKARTPGGKKAKRLIFLNDRADNVEFNE